MEKQITNEFRKIKNKLIRKHGRKSLFGSEVNKISKELFGAKYKGTHAQDKIKWVSGFQIINTDTSNGPGEHWVALYLTKKNIYVFDSFGRPTPSLLKILTKEAKLRGIKIKDSDKDAEQFGNSEVCGILCISWLYCVQKYGIKKAMLI